MIAELVLFLEVLSVYISVFRIYGEKIVVNAGGILFIVSSFSVLECINVQHYNSIFSFLTYIFLYLFCYWNFRVGVKKTIVAVIVTIAVTICIQFMCALFISFFRFENVIHRDLLLNMMVLMIVFWVLPLLKAERLRGALYRIHWMVFVILGFVFSVLFGILFSMKIYGGMNFGIFFYGIPAIAIIFFLLFYWNNSVNSVKRMAEELEVIEASQKEYDDLLSIIRLNQHGLKNHIMAIEAIEYTCKDSVQLKKTRQEYYKNLKEANKYNRLLKLEDAILIGFLYAKLRELETAGVCFDYNISTQICGGSFSYVCMVEVLGILFDNAREAVLAENGKGQIFFEVKRAGEGIQFEVRNTSRNVTYEEIHTWFEKGRSTKGKQRGLGLYQLKKCCNECGYSLLCTNREIDDINWIVFEITVKKDGL